MYWFRAAQAWHTLLSSLLLLLAVAYDANLEPLKGRVPNADRLAISTRNLGEVVVV
jgi:hypothetical protein